MYNLVYRYVKAIYKGLTAYYPKFFLYLPVLGEHPRLTSENIQLLFFEYVHIVDHIHL